MPSAVETPSRSSAGDGNRALELLRAAAAQHEPYDIVLMDTQMPGITGFELARAIKGDPSIAAVPLVLMTSFGQRGDGQVAREIGVAAYLTKPVKFEELHAVLARWLSGSPLIENGPRCTVDRSPRNTFRPDFTRLVPESPCRSLHPYIGRLAPSSFCRNGSFRFPGALGRQQGLRPGR